MEPEPVKVVVVLRWMNEGVPEMEAVLVEMVKEGVPEMEAIVDEVEKRKMVHSGKGDGAKLLM